MPAQDRKYDPPQKLRRTIMIGKLGSERFDPPKLMDVLIPMPKDPKSPQDFQRVWEQFKDWGEEYEAKSGEESPDYPVMWIDSPPKYEDIILRGVRNLLTELGTKKLTETIRAAQGTNGKRRGRGVSSFKME